MTALIRAELMKIRTTKLVYWLGLTAVALAGLSVAGTVFSPQQSGAAPLSTPEGVRAVFAAASAGSALSMVLGIVGMAGEWRHRTATATFLGVPRRGRVVTAKVFAHALVGLVYAVAVIAVTVTTAVICLRVKQVDYSITSGGIPSVLLGAALVTAIYAVLGVGYGALVRNQIAAIVSALLWTTAADALLVQFLPSVGRWTPGGASAALTQLSREGVHVLPVWAGALLLTAYGGLFAVIGLRTTVSRDVT
jgi:hypothetical protein